MPSLRELQRGFADALFGGDSRAFAARIVADGIDAEARLRVYRNNVYASLTEALLAVYPVVARLVGEPFFRALAPTYIGRHPPASGDIHDFGGRFAALLAADARLSALPYLADVARLEWAWHRVYHAPVAARRFDAAGLAALDPAQQARLRLQLQPAARLLASNYPVLRIWELNQDGAPDDARVHLDEGGERVLVLRRGLDMEFHRLSPGAHALLAALHRQHPLAQAQQAAFAAEPGFDLAGALHGYLRLDLLVGWDLAPLEPPTGNADEQLH